jgi:gas vesicle protein
MSAKSIVSAFLGGVAAGAVLGILMAPESGVETRKKLAKKAQDSKDSLNQLVEEGKKSWYETQGKVANEAGIAANEVDRFVRHILEKGRNWWNEAQERAEDVADETADAFDDVVQDGKRVARDVAQEGRAKVNEFRSQIS